MTSENWLVMLQKRDTEKSQCLWITIFFKWETPATKYHIYFITNFMAYILADKILYSHFSFQKKTKKSWLVMLPLVMLHFVLRRRTQLLHEKIPLREYQSI